MTARTNVFTVALTGGIASGKTTVSNRLGTLGALIIDTDVLARQVVAVGSEGLAEVVAAFGNEVLDEQGALDRRALRARVFIDPVARKRLEAITHPRIRDAVLLAVASCQAAYAVIVVPLLVEHWQAYRWVDRVLVVDVSRQTQVQRLLARDGITSELADAMLDAQASRGERLNIADDVLNNEGDLPTLLAAVDALHQGYLAKARIPATP